MSEMLRADLCVIGGGAGGLSVAAGASQMGARVVLFESGAMGGDCLNHGCVPSKSILAAGRARARQRRDGVFGIRSEPGKTDFEAVKEHIRGVIAQIAPHDSVERFEGLGVRVVRERARFVAPDRIRGGATEVRARRFVIATGSMPAIPPIPGLADVPYLTNETVFEADRLPEHLLVIGGGPIGIELAQAFRNLGSRVTVVEMATILVRDDPELVDLLRTRLRDDGIELVENARVVSVGGDGGRVELRVDEGDGEPRAIEGSHLLVATGRVPSLGDLELEAAGIEATPRGVTVNRSLRSSNRRVYAIGDAAGRWQLTHVAGYEAGIVVRNVLFRLPARVDDSAVPRVTYCDPELASVGVGEAEARTRHARVEVLRWHLGENDRAVAERDTEGCVKVIVTPRGHILGASILATHAGEMVQMWCLAIQKRVGIGAVAQTILPYPTFGEANKRAAGGFYTPRLFSDRTRRVVRMLARLG